MTLISTPQHLFLSYLAIDIDVQLSSLVQYHVLWCRIIVVINSDSNATNNGHTLLLWI